MKWRLLTVLLLGFFTVAVTVQPAGAFYQWLDEQGNMHVTDYPPPSKTTPPVEREEEPVQFPANSAQPATAPSPTMVSMPASVMTSSSTSPSVSSPVTSMSGTAAAIPIATMPSALSGKVSQTISGASLTGQGVTTVVLPIPGPVRRGSDREAFATPAVASAAGIVAVVLFWVLLLYLYFSFSLYRIAKKLHLEEAWAAWVPIMQIWPFISAAGKPLWWIILLFVPFVNIVIGVYLWMCIAENLGRNKFLGLLSLIPVANIILPGYLAFSKSHSA